MIIVTHATIVAGAADMRASVPASRRNMKEWTIRKSIYSAREMQNFIRNEA